MTVFPSGSQETAAQHTVQRVPIARHDESVGKVLAQITGQEFDSIENIYVLDQAGRLNGLVRLVNLFTMSPEQPIGSVMTRNPPTAAPNDDQEEVAGLAVHYHLADVPVVDAQGYFCGVVPAQALIAILRREHIEDLHRLTGIQRESAHAIHALTAPPRRRTRDRLPWLLVGLLGSILATFVVARFEQTLETRVAVAFFVPGIVYLADAIGTQTEAIAVRGLSLHPNPTKDLLLNELCSTGSCGLSGNSDRWRGGNFSGSAVSVVIGSGRKRSRLWFGPGGYHYSGCIEFTNLLCDRSVVGNVRETRRVADCRALRTNLKP
jgi:magnesium transporter